MLLNYSKKFGVSLGSYSFQFYIDRPEEQQRLYKKILKVLIFAQIFGGAGIGAGITVGALLSQDMLGSNSAAGIPVAMFTFGSAIAAYGIGRFSQKYGRRNGLASGFLLGGLGGIGIILAAVFHHIPLLFLALFIYGAGMAANLQARFAGTDLAQPHQKGKAASLALVSTTFGAVLGPNLVGPMGKFAESVGIPTLAGPFIMSSIAFTVAGLIIFIWLRPDPLFVAKAIQQARNEANTTASLKIAEYENKKGIALGITVMVVAQLVMTGIMTMTPIHMGHHGHSLGQVGVVIGFHIGAMYFISPLTGILLDRFGRVRMVWVASFTLVLAGVVAAFAPGHSIGWLLVALILLGMGWNLGLLTGTAIVVDATTPSKSAKTQGSADVLVALSGAAGGGLSGLVVANASYQYLSLIGGVFALLLIPIILITSKRNKQTEEEI